MRVNVVMKITTIMRATATVIYDNGQFRSGVPSQGCLIICLIISLIQVKTKSIPSFLVWLITDPRLYYPLHQEKDTKNGTKDNENEAVLMSTSGKLS